MLIGCFAGVGQIFVQRAARFCQRQPHDKFAAFAEAFTVYFDTAIVKLNDSACQRKPNAQAAVTALFAAIALKEHVEKMRLHLRRDADIGVFDRDDYFMRTVFFCLVAERNR